MEKTYRYTEQSNVILDTDDTQINLADYKGRKASMAIDTLAFEVEIKDARIRFGRLDFLVSPNSGNGQKWVEQHKVAIA
jgi:hypothetical protein